MAQLVVLVVMLPGGWVLYADREEWCWAGCECPILIVTMVLVGSCFGSHMRQHQCSLPARPVLVDDALSNLFLFLITEGLGLVPTG
jgi:hypothetical protein